MIGVPHPELGEEVKAVVQLEPGSAITEDEVRGVGGRDARQLQGAGLRRDLTNDKLPRNASGKLLKNVLRGEGEVSFAETM